MRTIGVEEELLVVDPAGVPVPLATEALEVAARRGEGETVGEHDRAQQSDAAPDTDAAGAPAGPRLVPELKEQQIELGTRVCRELDEVAAELRHWRSRADAAATTVGAGGPGELAGGRGTGDDAG